MLALLRACAREHQTPACHLLLALPPRPGFRRSFTFSPMKGRELDSIACAGSSPVRALGHATFVDFCHRIRSASTVVGLPKPMSTITAVFRRRVGCMVPGGSSKHPCVSKAVRKPGSRAFLDQRSCWNSRRPAVWTPSRRDGSRRRLCPDPIRARTPHVALATAARLGEALQAIVVRRQTPLMNERVRP
jgi:hypothetical protein